MVSPIQLGASIFPLTLVTVPVVNLEDAFNEMLILINNQCASQTAGQAPVVVFDNQFTIEDEGDTSKQLVFSLGGGSASSKMTIASSPTANRTLTLPDATDTLVSKGTQAITDGTNMTIGTTSGSIIGQASSLIGFFGTTAAIKPVASAELGAALATLGLRGSGAPPISVASVTIADASNVNIGTTSGSIIGQASSKLGFFGATATTAIAYSAAAAVATTAAATGAIYGFTTAAQANAIVSLVNALRAGQVSLGLGLT